MSDYTPRHAGDERPGELERDARQRAWRTFWQGLLVDVGGAVLVVVVGMVSGLVWTRDWWLAAAAVVGKTVVMSAVAYLARVFIPPAGRG